MPPQLAQVPGECAFNSNPRAECQHKTPLGLRVDAAVGLLELERVLAHVIQHVDARAAAYVAVILQHLTAALQLVGCEL